MVQWKGQIEGDVGEKATNLDRLEDFNVPNFFVITPEEVRELFKDVKGKDQVLNSQVKGEIRNEIKKAYEDIGVSSEVRNAVGKAKSLVGGQRSNPRVSVRVSNKNPGEYRHKLNVGSSNLFEAIKEVASSYYEKNNDHPSIIVQKMVEPEYTGSVIPGYSQNGLVEIVEGLGSALEEGSERPHFYLIGRRGIVDKDINNNQIKVERNPINGEKQKKSSSKFNMDDREIKEFYGEVAQKDIGVKFVYKRGSFQIVDAWSEEGSERRIEKLNGIKIGSGSFSGEIGREIKRAEAPISPEKYRSMVSTKGGYTSSKVQKSRRNGKTAVVGYPGKLEEGDNLRIDDENIVSKEDRKENLDHENPVEELSDNIDSREGTSVKSLGSDTASEVLPLDPNRGDGLYTGSVFDKGKKLVRKGEKQSIEEKNTVDGYEDVFGFEESMLLLDIRELDNQEEIIEYLDAEEKILLLENCSVKVLEKAVEQGFEMFVAPAQKLDRVKAKISKAEKRFIINELREK